MELVLKHPDDGPLEPAKDLVVVVACEDAESAPRACALLKRVGRNAGEGGRLIYSWWTFSVLESASLRQLAAREAAAADLVLIAAREGPGLPPAIKEWVRQWAPSENTAFGSRALVALLESDQTDHAATHLVLNELKELAAQGSLEFFANGDEIRSEPPPGAAPRHSLEGRD